MFEDVAIHVNHVSKTFKLPHEKNTSIKGLVVNFYRHKRTFESQKVLKDVSFEIRQGEFFGIVGRNGSGKSTLLKMLAGIYSPTQGGITVNGKLTPFIELGVGFNPELTGRENVYLNGALLGFNRKEMNAMYNDIVTFAELEKFMDQKLKNYSSGMQVRLAFSIAIRARSDILLLDEVLAVGDSAFQQKCYDYFEELKRQRKTVVFVSHDMNAVRRFCERAVYIKNGQLTDEGSASDIADIYIAENIDQPKAGKAGSDNVAKKASKHEISSKIVKQDQATLEYKVNFKSKESDALYVGISVIKDGVSISEVVTPEDMPLQKNGNVFYSLDLSLFNGGMYYITAALFKLKNRQLVAICEEKDQFTIKGSDIRRGGAVKLADTWAYDSNDLNGGK